MKKTWIPGGTLLASVLLCGIHPLLSGRPQGAGNPGAPRDASNAVAAGRAGSPTGSSHLDDRGIQTLLRAAHEAIEAGKRGEDLGTTPWSKTPEDVLDAVLNRFDEPFQPLALERLAKAMPNLKSPHDRVRAAALLHRYGNATGTAFLRERAAGTEEGSILAVTVLAKTRDVSSIPLLVHRLTTAEWRQLEIPLLEAVGAWAEPRLTQALTRRSERGEPNQAWIARTLVQQGIYGAWDRLPASTLETMRSFPTDQLDLEAVSVRRSGRPGPDWGDRLFSGLRQNSKLPHAGILSSARLAGPIAGRESLERFLNGYIDHKTRWNSDYRKHVTAIRNGSKEWSFFGDDTYNDAAVLGALELLAEWGGDHAAEIAHRFLETHLQGPHSAMTVETILGVLVRLDSKGLDARAAAMGITPGTLTAAKALSALRPLPVDLMPKQAKKSTPIFP